MPRRAVLALALLPGFAGCSVYHQAAGPEPTASGATFSAQVRTAEAPLLATLYPRNPVAFIDRQVVAVTLSRFADRVSEADAPTSQTIAKAGLVSAARAQALVVSNRLISEAADAARALDGAVRAVDPTLPRPYNVGASSWGLQVQNLEDANLDGTDTAADYDRLADAVRRTSPPLLLAPARRWLIAKAHEVAGLLRAGKPDGLPAWEITSAISSLRRAQPHSPQF